MAFAVHRRLTFRGRFGTLVSPYEEWSFRVNMTVGISPPVDQVALLDAAQAAWTAQFRPLMRPWAALTELKTAVIGPDGKYNGDPTIKAVNVLGTGQNATGSPAQVALGVSLNTALRGPRGRGRFFLPAPVHDPNGDTGLILGSDAQDVANRAAAFVTALNAVSGAGDVCVASSFGMNTPVTSVRCGRVLDTIRSRRSSINEGYGANVGTTQYGLAA
jgi:hypothetical protein